MVNRALIACTRVSSQQLLQSRERDNKVCECPRDLARLNSAVETRPGFGKTFVDDRQQRPGRERLAQTARGTESSAMRRKSGAGESTFAKAYPDIATRGIAGARS